MRYSLDDNWMDEDNALDCASATFQPLHSTNGAQDINDIFRTKFFLRLSVCSLYEPAVLITEERSEEGNVCKIQYG
jgi:hypothetical protein